MIEKWTPLDRFEPKARSVAFSETTLSLELQDGKIVSLPLSWYPRLVEGTPDERKNWRIVGEEDVIFWPELFAFINVKDLLAGRRSDESPASLSEWLQERAAKTQHS